VERLATNLGNAPTKGAEVVVAAVVEAVPEDVAKAP
jgi:hypothetical protein